ncbi:L,D-transpeptidase [Patescibacteria group bacterium]
MRNFFIVCIVVLVLTVAFFVSSAYDYVLGGDVQIENNEDIDIREAIVIDFSTTIFEKEFEDHITISPKTDVEYVLGDGRSLMITPVGGWILGVDYDVKVERVKNFMLADSGGNVGFSTRNYPKIEGFYPESDSENVVVDIEDPIKINFDQPLSDFNIKLDVNPESRMEYSVDKDKKGLSFVFKDGYQKGENYVIGVYAKHKKEGEYKKIYESSFETEIPPIDEWSNDFGLRIKQARKFTKAKINAGKYIDINLKKQILSIFDNGSVVDSFLISSGKRGMDTPMGTFKVANKHPRPWSKKYSLFMPYWMAIVPSGKFGIHELPEWPGGYKEGQDHLGIPVSHGCVRLGVGAAEKVYNWAEIGIPVVVY